MNNRSHKKEMAKKPDNGHFSSDGICYASTVVHLKASNTVPVLPVGIVYYSAESLPEKAKSTAKRWVVLRSLPKLARVHHAGGEIGIRQALRARVSALTPFA